MIEPPASRPTELLALTTTDCPDSNARRSDPFDVRVIAAEIAVIPQTMTTPETAPNTATLVVLAHRPMPAQHSPVIAQAAPASGTAGNLLTTFTATSVPSRAPTPYPLMPAAT